jgi:hypothetical protein
MADHSDVGFVDLEIRLFPPEAQGYPVEITLAEHQVFPRGYLAADVVDWAPTGDARQDGQALFDRLFADPVLRDVWVETRAQAPRRRIRLRIDPGAAALHALPWEQLRDGDVLLAAHEDTPFSRFLPTQLPWKPMRDDPHVRVLVAISNPADLEAVYGLPPLDVAREREAVAAALDDVNAQQEQAFADGTLRASSMAQVATYEVTFLEPPITLARLVDELQGDDDVLHYVGHGAFSRQRGEAVLYLQDDAGDARPVPDRDLIQALTQPSVRPQLIVLAACQSAARATTDAFVGLGPKLIQVGVPSVVAMQDFVTMETARQFSTAFYRALLRHRQVDRAMNAARSTLLTAGRADVAVPVLLTRLQSGRLGAGDVRGVMLGDRNPRIFWTGLIKYIQRGKCTPIIGPRARGRWLPSPVEIALKWAQEHGYPFSDKTNPSRIAQYMAISQGEHFPIYELIDDLLAAFAEKVPTALRPADTFDTLSGLADAIGWQPLTAEDPNEVHRVLASLDLPLYLTTNFDNFLCEALEAQGKQPVREICRWNEALDWLPSIFDEDPQYEPSPERPLVYHLFGNDQELDSMVLTEDAHFDFLVNVSAEMDRIHPYIWAALTNTSLMFLGYRLHDWGFRVIMRGLLAPMQRRRRFKHVGVQLEPEEVREEDVPAVHRFLQDYFQDNEINVYLGGVQQFIAELRENWEASDR